MPRENTETTREILLVSTILHVGLHPETNATQGLPPTNGFPVTHLLNMENGNLTPRSNRQFNQFITREAPQSRSAANEQPATDVTVQASVLQTTGEDPSPVPTSVTERVSGFNNRPR